MGRGEGEDRHGRWQQICACSKCIRNVFVMLSFAYEFALSANPLLYLELLSEFVMNVKTNKILDLCQQQILIVHQAFGFDKLSYFKFCFQI